MRQADVESHATKKGGKKEGSELERRENESLLSPRGLGLHRSLKRKKRARGASLRTKGTTQWLGEISIIFLSLYARSA